MRRVPRIFTWHIHGNYLLYLSQCRAEFYLPVRTSGGEGYGGRGRTFPFGDNVHDVPAEAVRELDFDCILFQTRKNYEIDQHELFTPDQRCKPQIYLQHDPPLEEPTEQRHWFDNPNGFLVHVTPFNALMWDSGRTPARTIDHGVFVPDDVRYSGEIAGGLTVINHLRQRGRRLGADIFTAVRREIPLELVGMNAESLGGLGEVRPPDLPAFAARYRFFFHPVRYTSLGLAIVEAMMIGLPIVGLATTELVTVVENGVQGYIDTDVNKLIEPMRELLGDPQLARRLGANARQRALERFSIKRFAREWEQTFATAIGSGHDFAPSEGRAASSRSDLHANCLD